MSTIKPTSIEVIDRLFSRLAATYGAEWTRQWAGVPPSDVKTTWCYELERFMDRLPAIAHAIANLPERCPNVIQFRNLCRTAPALEVPEIEAPKASPERVANELAKLVLVPVCGDDKEWARRILKRHEAGEKIRPYSLNLAKGALNLKNLAVPA